MKKIEITTEFIKLDQFLKFIDITSTGGEGKEYIASGKIKVNNEIETRRGRKLRDEDVIEVEGNLYKIVSKI